MNRLTVLLAALLFVAFTPAPASAAITWQEATSAAAFATYGNARDDFNAAFNPWTVYQCPHAGTCWSSGTGPGQPTWSTRSAAQINPSLWLVDTWHFAYWTPDCAPRYWRVLWGSAVREHADGSLYVTDKVRNQGVTMIGTC